MCVKRILVPLRSKSLPEVLTIKQVHRIIDACLAMRIARWESPEYPRHSWTMHLLASDQPGATNIHPADVNRDGQVDLVASRGQGNFTTHVIDTNQQAYDIRALDMDQGGDLDLLVAGRQSNNVVWYANPIK